MTSNFEKFKKLHAGSEAFILPNAWDAQSAAIFQENNYPAVGTSSAAVSASLGYTDGEGMPFSDYLFVVKRIAASVNIPITIDIEMGYGKNRKQIYENLQKLISTGVVGINIEDSVITGGTRGLKDPDEFASTIAFISGELAKADRPLFLNVRCDTYLLKIKNAEKETAHRINIYESAGANGIFLPFISNEKHIAAAVSSTRLPINVMACPGVPDVKTLSQLGVKRISMGPFLHIQTYSKATELAKKVNEDKSLKSILKQ